MKIRTIELTEISQFEQIGTEEGNKPTLNLHKWLDVCRTKLEWCFVAEESGVFLGSIIYGIFEDQPQDLKIWQFKIDDKTSNFMEIGTRLIKNSLELLKDQSFQTVEYHLYSSLANDLQAYQSLFMSQGFELTQEKSSFEATQIHSIERDQRLSYKTLQEIGGESFIAAIECVTHGTLDRDDLESISLNGSAEAATMYFDLLKDIDFNNIWWRLAYQQDGEFVGLVVPQRFSEDSGAINYIGVAPNKRGKGYVYDLLEEASRLMLKAGIQKIIADIDVQNHPLEGALKKIGYIKKRSLSILKLVIA